jgi:hypothetical protein
LLQSNQFDTTWTKIRSSVTSGQIGYDGTSNAWAFNDNTDNSSHLLFQSVSATSQVATFSVYAKAADADFLSVRFGSTTNYAYFNLSNGSLGTIHSIYIDAKIEAVGNGWYRCSLSKTLDASSNLAVMLPTQADNSNTYAGTGNAALYVQDAQVELGLAASPYIETGATTAQAGILENTPRFDYSGGATCPSLLLEPSRTNVISQSEYFDSSEWDFFTGATLGSSFVVSPEGYNNATTLNFGSGSESLIFFDYSSGSATFTTSVWARSSTGKKFSFRHWNGSTAERSSDFTTTTEWKRFEFTFTSAVVNFGICNESSGVSGSIEIYGAQAETGSYPTSYIPTYGSSQTRAQDICINLSLTTSTDFTIFFEAKDFCLINGSTGGAYDNVQFVFSGDGAPYSANGSFHIYNNTLYYYNGSTPQGFGLIYNNQTDSKFVIMKRGDKVLAFANGSKITEATLPSGADAKVINWDAINLTLSLQDGQGDVFGSKYQQLLKFDTALTDSECIALTTI